MTDKKKQKEEKKRRKAENKKKPFVDDGHTIVDMNVEGFPWYDENRSAEKEKKNRDKPTKKETFAMIMGAYKAYLPMFLICIGVFTIVFLILWLLLQMQY